MNGGKPTRTYHCNLSSVRAGERTSAKGAIDYVARDGDFEAKAADLECVVGDTTALNEATAEIERTARIKRGPTAEKILVKNTFELPADLNAEQRKAVAEAAVRQWEDRGHVAIAAVHANDVVQPHVHLLITARPIVRTDIGDIQSPLGMRQGWVVDRTPGKVAYQTKAAVRKEREDIATIVNAVMDHGGVSGPRFFAGRDAQMEQPGIVGRRPLRRVPMGDFVYGQSYQSPAMVERVRDRREAERAAVEAQRQQMARDREAKAERGRDVAVSHSERAPKVAERAFRPATDAQRRFILRVAAEAGVTLRDGVLDRFDGGDLIAAVKLAKAARAQQKELRGQRHSQDAVALVFAEELGKAEQRRIEATERAIVAEAGVERLTGRVQELGQTLDTLHEVEIAALVEIRVAEVLRKAVAQQPAIPVDHPDRIEAGRTKQYRIMKRFFGLRSADAVQEDIKITPEVRLASWDSGFTAGVEVRLRADAAARHDRLSTVLIQTKAQLVDERAKRQAAEDQVALAELAATIKGERVGGTLRADRDAAKIENVELRQTVARQATQLSELVEIVHDPDTALGSALSRTQAAEQEAAALRVASERTAEELDRYASEREGLETRVREAEKRALEASTPAVAQPAPHLPKTAQTLRERFPHHVFADERTEPTQLVKALLGEYLMKRIADTKGALAEESLPRTQRGFQLGLQGLTHWAIQLGALEPRAATPPRPLSLDGGNSL